MLTRRAPMPIPTLNSNTMNRGMVLKPNPLLPVTITRTPPPNVQIRMRNIDVMVKFDDGSEVELLALARHPLRAVMTVISEAERTISVERLLGIKSIEFR